MSYNFFFYFSLKIIFTSLQLKKVFIKKKYFDKNMIMIHDITQISYIIKRYTSNSIKTDILYTKDRFIGMRYFVFMRIFWH